VYYGPRTTIPMTDLPPLHTSTIKYASEWVFFLHSHCHWNSRSVVARTEIWWYRPALLSSGTPSIPRRLAAKWYTTPRGYEPCSVSPTIRNTFSTGSTCHISIWLDKIMQKYTTKNVKRNYAQKAKTKIFLKSKTDSYIIIYYTSYNNDDVAYVFLCNKIPI